MKEIIIDGNDFSDIDGFYRVCEQCFVNDAKMKMGHNLDAFNDVLRGGFGVFDYEENISIIWKNYDKSVHNLGEEFMNTVREIIDDHDNCKLFCVNVNDMGISNNDLYIYFEIISQIEPEVVFDFGPVLMRAGCIARQAKDRGISDDIKLFGIDYSNESNCNVYNKIYDTVYKSDIIKSLDTKADLAIAFKLTDMETKAVYDWSAKYSKYLLTDCDLKAYHKKDIKTVTVDNDCYYLYSF